MDIGAEPISFKVLLLGAARVMGLKRYLVPVPLLTPRLSSYWLNLMTPVPFGIARALVEGLKSETIVLNDNAARLFPQIRPASSELTQTAYFLPKGLGGRMYWWAMKPFHALIFGRMIKKVVELAGRLSSLTGRLSP